MSGPVLVTGAAGRIGRLAMERLPALGWKVRGCDLVEGKGIAAADIRDVGALTAAAAGCGAIVHLAATPNARPGWAAVMALNVGGARNALEAARRVGARRVLLASSIQTVGALPADTPLGPDLPPAPSGVYGASKLAAEALGRVYAAKAGLDVLALRICSFRRAPREPRERQTSLSHDDAAHLIDRGLRAAPSNYAMAWGVSANANLAIEDPVARAMGCRPRQDASRHEVPDGPDWALLGGPVAAQAELDFLD